MLTQWSVSLELLAKFIPVLSALFGLPAALLVWWTAHRNQRHQATKAELDALLAAAKDANDEPYRHFLLELHKERIVSFAVGREVPLTEVGKVMRCYQRAEHSAADLRALWPYRDRKATELRFVLEGWDTAQLCCAVFLLVTCVFEMVLCQLVVVLSPGLTRWSYLALEIAFGAAFVLLARFHRGLFLAHRLSPATKRWSFKGVLKASTVPRIQPRVYAIHSRLEKNLPPRRE